MVGSSLKTKSAFKGAVSGRLPKKLPSKKVMALGAVVLMGGGWYLFDSNFVPPQGNILFGICRVFIERKLQYPHTMKIIEMIQDYDKANRAAPKWFEYGVTYTSLDGFGQSSLRTVSCHFTVNQQESNTPSKGILLDRVRVDGRENHGWSDIYMPPDRKNPRMPGDNSEELEEFNVGVPSILAYPPDLTLPWYNLKYMSVERLKDM